MRVVYRAATLASVMIVGSLPVNAQGDFEEVVVTAQRQVGYTGNIAPHVTLTRRADHMVTIVRVVCDTRDATQRAAELRDTLRAMIAEAGRGGSISLSSGSGVLVPFDETMIEKAIFPDDAKPDTSYAEVVVKTAITADDTFDAAVARIESFLGSTAKVGRTEVLASGEWNLSIVEPERNREELLKRIAEDAASTSALFGDRMAVGVAGLENPIMWHQSGPLDLALYIEYRLSIGSPPAP